MNFRLVLKWVSPIQSPVFTNSSTTKQYPLSVRGKEVSCESARVSIISVGPDESVSTRTKDSVRASACSSAAVQIVENSSIETEEMKLKTRKGPGIVMYDPFHSITTPVQDEKSILNSSFHTNKTSYFGLLVNSLEKVEELFSDVELIRLEQDIMMQLGKLGALKLFHAYLSRNLKTTTTTTTAASPLNFSVPLTVIPEDSPTNAAVNDGVGNAITVRSGRKEERISKRKRALENAAKLSYLSPTMKKISKANFSSNKRSRRVIVAKNESEMSRGVKEVTNLERIRTMLEEETGRVASFSSWAEAARIDEKTLKERLHFGWYCRDKLLKSTRSLVLFLARNYRGVGISSEDLLQAGFMGVLQGAERYDHTRGCRFSTYVQYWIRKSMSAYVALNSRGVQLPVTLARAIYQIQKARKTLHILHGRYPDDNEIATFTGLSLRKIRLASKSPRIVGSIDQKLGDDINIKFMEFTPDTSVETPDEVVMKQHMQKDVYKLLEDLDQRERQVLILRHGFWDGQCKSLEEIGRLFNVTKEWIRKIERSALTKVNWDEMEAKLSAAIGNELDYLLINGSTPASVANDLPGKLTRLNQADAGKFIGACFVVAATSRRRVLEKYLNGVGMGTVSQFIKDGYYPTDRINFVVLNLIGHCLMAADADTNKTDVAAFRARAGGKSVWHVNLNAFRISPEQKRICHEKVNKFSLADAVAQGTVMANAFIARAGGICKIEH